MSGWSGLVTARSITALGESRQKSSWGHVPVIAISLTHSPKSRPCISGCSGAMPDTCSPNWRPPVCDCEPDVNGACGRGADWPCAAALLEPWVLTGEVVPDCTCGAALPEPWLLLGEVVPICACADAAIEAPSKIASEKQTDVPRIAHLLLGEENASTARAELPSQKMA